MKKLTVEDAHISNQWRIFSAIMKPTYLMYLPYDITSLLCAVIRLKTPNRSYMTRPVTYISKSRRTSIDNREDTKKLIIKTLFDNSKNLRNCRLVNIEKYEEIRTKFGGNYQHGKQELISSL